MSATSYAEVLLDEICLEGLDGITPDTLWIRLATRFGSEPSETLKRRFWDIAKRLHDVDYYLLPSARPAPPRGERFRKNEKGTWSIDAKFQEADAEIYPFKPVKGVYGSCADYDSRVDVTNDIGNYSFEDIVKKYHDILVIVGKPEVRWRTLASGISSAVLSDLSDVQYCILERIGRTRFNGEPTKGEACLSALKMDSKAMFHNRKVLLMFGLVVTQSIPFVDKNQKISLTMNLSLPRFYRECIEGVEYQLKLVKRCFRDRKECTVSEFKSFMMEYMSEKLYTRFRKSAHLSRAVVFQLCPNSVKIEDIVRAYNQVTKKVWTVTLKEEPSEKKKSGKTKGSGHMIGETLLRETYLCISDTGLKGVTLSDLAKKLESDKLTARIALKYLTLSGVLCTVTEDVNRIKRTRYFCQKFKHKVGEDLQNAKKKLSVLYDLKTETGDEAKETAAVEDGVASDEPCGTANKHPKLQSLRKLNRIDMILDMVSKSNIISNLREITKYISLKEANEDKNGEIDIRSLYRLLLLLDKEKKINFHKIMVKGKNNHITLNIVCKPEIDVDHPQIQAHIQETRMRLSREVTSFPHEMDLKQKLSPRDSKMYGLLPKFSKMRVFHSFLFYITYCHKNVPQEHSGALKKLIEDENLDAALFPTYADDNGDYLFVPPLADSAVEPKRWILLTEIMNRLPLCLFVKLINVNYHVTGLLDILKHPIKNKFLINNLPEKIKSELLYKRKYVISLYELVVRLCFAGLVQLGKTILKEKDTAEIYINQYALLWNTTTSKPGYYKIEEKEYDSEIYHLQSMQDVDAYWDRLNSICINTKLGERNAVIGEMVEARIAYPKLSKMLKENTIEDAVRQDTGFIMGDGMGAAGLDSSLFSHLKKSWTRDIQDIKPIKKKYISKSVVTVNCPRKRPLIGRGQVPVEKPPKEEKKAMRMILPRKQMVLPRKPVLSDVVDERALKVLGGRKTTWNSMENRVILVSKIAIIIMCPKMPLLLVPVVRDVLHWCLQSTEKTTAACRRRLKFTTLNPQMARTIELYVAEIKRDTALYRKYHNLYTHLNIATKDANILDFQIMFVEFIHLILQQLYKRVIAHDGLQLPDSVDAIYKNFTVETPQSKIVENPQVPKVEAPFSIWKGVLCSVIHSVLGCVMFKDNNYYSMLSLYRKYPEYLLRDCVSQLNRSGMLASCVMRTSDESNTSKTDRKEAYHKEFKLSTQYSNSLSSAYSYKIFSQAIVCMNRLLENDDGVTSELIDGGSTALTLDLLTMENLELELTIPVDVIVADPKSSQSIKQEVFSNENDLLQSRSSLSLVQIIENKMDNPNDLYIINSCNLVSKIKNVDKLFGLSTMDKDTFVENILKEAVYDPSMSEQYDIPKSKDVFLEMMRFHISNRENVGASIKDVNDFASEKGIPNPSKILKELEDKNTIRRVGNEETRWVSTNYLEDWLVRAVKGVDMSNIERLENLPLKSKASGAVGVGIDDDPSNPTKKRKREPEEDDEGGPSKRRRLSDGSSRAEDVGESEQTENSNQTDERDDVEMLESNAARETAIMKADAENKMMSKILLLPRPWIKPDATVNFPLLWRWIRSVLNYMLSHPLVRLSDLGTHFKYMERHHLRVLLEMMVELSLVEIFTQKKKKTTLWCESSCEFRPATVLEDDDKLYVEVVNGALTQYVLFKRKFESKDNQY